MTTSSEYYLSDPLPAVASRDLSCGPKEQEEEYRRSIREKKEEEG